MLHIKQVLTPEQAARRARVERGRSGSTATSRPATSRRRPSATSSCREDSPVAQELGRGDPRARSSAARSSCPPRCRSTCSRRSSTATRGGMTFGNHVDNAIRVHAPHRGRACAPTCRPRCSSRRPRTTTAASCWSRTPTACTASKLPAGDLVLYPATSLHRVDAGDARRARLVVLLDPEHGRRRRAAASLLFDLDMAIVRLDARHARASRRSCRSPAAITTCCGCGRSLERRRRRLPHRRRVHRRLLPASRARTARLHRRDQRLRAAAASSGRFTWCELGCGQGITSLILAATHPSGEFHALRLQRRAHRARRGSALGGRRRQPAAFTRAASAKCSTRPAARSTSSCCTGCTAGCRSRCAARSASSSGARLRPGGLVMVSYNAMPGWAHLAPIRRMMRALCRGAARRLARQGARRVRVRAIARPQTAQATSRRCPPPRSTWKSSRARHPLRRARVPDAGQSVRCRQRASPLFGHAVPARGSE